MNLPSTNRSALFGYSLLITTVFICVFCSALFCCSEMFPEPVEFFLRWFGGSAIVAEITGCAILISTIHFKAATRLIITIFAPLIMSLPITGGYLLSQDWFFEFGGARPPFDSESFWIVVSVIPLMVCTLGFGLQILRIHRDFQLTMDTVAERKVPSRFHFVWEYFVVFVSIAISISLTLIGWPGDDLGVWPAVSMLIAASVIVGFVVLTPMLLIAFRLHWHGLILCVTGMVVIGLSTGLAILPKLYNGTFWGVPARLAPYFLLLLLLIIFGLITVFLIGLRLIGFQLRFQKYQPRVLRQSESKVHPLD